MQYLSVASLRKAAKALTERSEVVSVKKLAQEMGVECALVRHYVYGIRGLREELNCTSKAGTPSKPYLKFICLLRDRNVTITYRRIALLTGSRERESGSDVACETQKRNS